MDLSIDAALADEMTLAEEPVAPQQASQAVPPARSLPPKRSSVANGPTPDTTPFPGSAATSGAIPPRRYPLGAAPQPHPVNPRAPSADSPMTTPEPAAFVPPPAPAPAPEPEEIEVLDARSTIPIGEEHSSSEPAAENTHAIDELRLALEASHNELSHLTSQRDQVATRAARQEEDIERLRAELDELHAAQELVQQQHDRTQQLETELAEAREQLDQARSSTSAIEQDHAKHQATMEELRIILAEREAMEASLGRERDNLVAQNEDLQRRLESASDAETRAAGQAAQQVAEQAETQVAAFRQRNQQIEAELSLSNETIRQLNQNINQRDAELAQLRRQVQTLQSELETAETESSEVVVDESVIREIQQQHEASLAELRQIIADRDATIDEQTDRHTALEAKLADVEATAAESPAPVESPAASELTLATETIRQLNQTLLARDAELIKLRQELREAASTHDAADKLDAELQRIRQELDEARNTCAEFESLQESLQAKTTDFDALQAEHHTLKVRFESEVGALMSKLEAKPSQRDLETLQAAERELTELTNKQAAELERLQEEQIELKQKVSELDELRAMQASDLGRRIQLEEENREYRRSVAELHASLNELEEFKLERERERESARQKLQEAVLANAELTAEMEALKSKCALAEQQAQALRKDARPTETSQVNQSDKSSTASKDPAKKASRSARSAKTKAQRSAASASGSKAKTKTIPSKTRRSEQADDLKQISGIGAGARETTEFGRNLSLRAD